MINPYGVVVDVTHVAVLMLLLMSTLTIMTMMILMMIMIIRMIAILLLVLLLGLMGPLAGPSTLKKVPARSCRKFYPEEAPGKKSQDLLP